MLKYKGINSFALEIIALISKGYKETIEEIENNMYKGNLVNYLYDKYEKHFDFDFGKNSIYDINLFNEFFFDMSSYVNGNEKRKYGIVNENDGLLLVVAIILDFFKMSKGII